MPAQRVVNGSCFSQAPYTHVAHCARLRSPAISTHATHSSAFQFEAFQLSAHSSPAPQARNLAGNMPSFWRLCACGMYWRRATDKSAKVQLARRQQKNESMIARCFQQVGSIVVAARCARNCLGRQLRCARAHAVRNYSVSRRVCVRAREKENTTRANLSIAMKS